MAVTDSPTYNLPCLGLAVRPGTAAERRPSIVTQSKGQTSKDRQLGPQAPRPVSSQRRRARASQVLIWAISADWLRPQQLPPVTRPSRAFSLEYVLAPTISAAIRPRRSITSVLGIACGCTAPWNASTISLAG